MTQMPMTSQSYCTKIMALRITRKSEEDVRKYAFHRAVIETLRNPVIARAVARGLRHDRFEKA